MRTSLVLWSCLAPVVAQAAADPAAHGYRRLWQGTDFAGWHGQRHLSPYELARLDAAARARLRAEDDAAMRAHWRVDGGELVNDGAGAYLTSDAEFGDAEYRLEYRTVAGADSGIYLRGCPQVQIWDWTEAGGKWSLGADKGSGGLWNNERHQRFPPRVADRPFGEWNRLEIRQVGERVWVRLNDVETTAGVVMENYWDRSRPLPPRGPLQLQTHGGEIRFRALWVKDLTAAEANALLAAHDADGFEPIFDGRSLAGWQGAVDDYEVAGGAIRCKQGRGGVLFSARRYGDCDLRFEFRLPAGGNNGLAIRYPGEGDPAYTGNEVQVLDDSAPQHATLQPWQYHGSVYGVAAAHRGYLRPVGQWNFQQVALRGTRVTVVLNGTTIVDADVAALPTQLGERHTGKDRSEGFVGFCGHGSAVEFRAVQIRPR
ncbi:MAG: DUF1080 domain-containing protein [Planctomycetes bacterium]|nr:DUF1080 domain-containing protein [Planctomycetota bacterium]